MPSSPSWPRSTASPETAAVAAARPDFARLLAMPLWELADLPLRKVRVAVLDTGIDATHPALRGRIARAAAYLKDDTDTISSAPLPRRANNDPAGHGTGVAAIIAALAPNAVIHDCRVLDADSSGFGSVVLRGLADAIESDADIINVSIAFSKDRWWAETSKLLEDAFARGKIVVASKRNFPRPGDLGLPAELPTAISVDAAAVPSPWLLRQFPRARISFAAQGHAVLTARPGGGWTRLTGTSFATPVVAALCALFLGAAPGLELFELKTLLKHHATGRLPAPPPPNPLETAPSAAPVPGCSVPWTCPSCGATATVPDAFPTVRCPACNTLSSRPVLLDPRLYFNFLEELRATVPPRFAYHNADHARDVVAAVYAILPRHPALPLARKRELLLAALLHDFCYADDPANHEEASATFAASIARHCGFTPASAGRVAALVRATLPSHVPSSLPEKIIRDADLFHIGSPDHARRADALRAELAGTGVPMTDAEWRARETAFLSAQRFHLPWLERQRAPARAALLRALSAKSRKSSKPKESP